MTLWLKHYFLYTFKGTKGEDNFITAKNLILICIFMGTSIEFEMFKITVSLKALLLSKHLGEEEQRKEQHHNTGPARLLRSQERSPNHRFQD